MAVYVDQPIYRYGRMLMCHMVADTTDELLAMADKIGVSRKWIQKPGTSREHFDICKGMRATAIEQGAIKVTGREIVLKMREKVTRTAPQ